MKKIFIILLLVFVGRSSDAQFTKLFDFSGASNGSRPTFADLFSDGTFLYGMTYEGGANDLGVIFKILPNGTGYVNIFDFNGLNGSHPNGSFISDGTYLYGTTNQGGAYNFGTVFKIKPDGTGYVDLHDFNDTAGTGGLGHLVSDGTFLYGLAGSGGANAMGVLYKIKPDGTGYSVLFDFSGASTGRMPKSSLVFDGTYLYGMTQRGGTFDDGTIFKIKTDGTNYTKLLDFSGGGVGQYPLGSLIFDGNFLYGTTASGGTTQSSGILFKIKPDGSAFANLLDFNGSGNGSVPCGSLISEGNFLYGLTSQGGMNNEGTIYKIKPDGTGYLKLFDLSNTTCGNQPAGSLISDGTFLYGMTEAGGVNSKGTIFKYQEIGMGVLETNCEIKLDFYPNPSHNGNISVEVGLAQNEHASLNVMNSLGQIIVSQEHDLQSGNNKLSLDLSAQAKGVYFIQIKTSTDVVTKKFVLK